MNILISLFLPISHTQKIWKEKSALFAPFCSSRSVGNWSLQSLPVFLEKENYFSAPLPAVRHTYLNIFFSLSFFATQNTRRHVSCLFSFFFLFGCTQGKPAHDKIIAKLSSPVSMSAVSTFEFREFVYCKKARDTETLSLPNNAIIPMEVTTGQNFAIKEQYLRLFWYGGYILVFAASNNQNRFVEFTTQNKKVCFFNHF